VEAEQPDKTKVKQIKVVSSDSEILSNTPALCANLFEMWLRDPANKDKVADIEPVPADMVMTSGSGLDPHISLRNAMSVYQLDRVVAKRTPKGGDAKAIREGIAALVRENSFKPLSGLLGEPLVNVLELNRALDAKFPVPASK
jgi:K+-transporting ATPase ATPase C chain